LRVGTISSKLCGVAVCGRDFLPTNTGSTKPGTNLVGGSNYAARENGAKAPSSDERAIKGEATFQKDG